MPGFLSPDTVASHQRAPIPQIEKGGSYPIESLERSMAIHEVIDELDGPEFEAAIAEKFDVALDGRPKMFSLRGYTRAKDGQIHTDSKDKIITVLLYLNEDWQQPGGRLRILRTATTSTISSPRCRPTTARCWSSSARTTPGTAIIPSKASAARCR